jgi:hypothetical protein
LGTPATVALDHRSENVPNREAFDLATYSPGGHAQSIETTHGSGPESSNSNPVDGTSAGLAQDPGVPPQIVFLSGDHDPLAQVDAMKGHDSATDKPDTHTLPELNDAKAENVPTAADLIEDMTTVETVVQGKELPEKRKSEDDEEARRLALLALMEEERRKLDEAQELYAVQPGDTLETIATAKFTDLFLAALVYELNRDRIPVQLIEGRKLYSLQERKILTLPSPRQIREWEPVRLSAWEEFRYGKSCQVVLPEPGQDSSSQKRRENIERYLGPLAAKPQKDTRIRLTVRLGDTLRSIAANHPVLNDVSLWPLLAKCNDLSAEINQDGVPVASVRRGMSLVLPSAAEINEYRQIIAKGGKANAPRQGIQAAINRNGMALVTGNKGQQSFSLKAKNLDDVEQKWVQETIINNLIEKLGDACRLVKSTSAQGNSPRAISQLEVLTGNNWVPILTYEICDSSAVRHEHKPDGQLVSMPIDLPASAVQQLASNDLKLNWRNYYAQFLRGRTETAL